MPNCCPVDLQPVESGYKKKDVHMYITGTGPIGVLVLTDIFGLHPNAYQLADTLAAQGFTVIMPDTYKEAGSWPAAAFPPKDGFESAPWLEFYGRATDYDSHLPTIVACKAMFERLGITRFGTVGMCVGAKQALVAQSRGIIGVVACPHPSLTTAVDGEAATAPVLLLPAVDDPKEDMNGFLAAISKKPFGDKCSVVFFDELRHGFLGARGLAAEASDYTNAATAHGAAKAVQLIVEFFKANV